MRMFGRSHAQRLHCNRGRHAGEQKGETMSGPDRLSRSRTTQQPWPWLEPMDALQVAAASHRVLWTTTGCGCWRW